jgi:hypothetical protein
VGKFSQETLAEMIGTTRSRVSFFMNKFRKLGFIEYNGRIEVHNSLLNMVLHEKPEIKTRDEPINADSGDCGQVFRLIADSDSDRSRTAFR